MLGAAKPGMLACACFRVCLRPRSALEKGRAGREREGLEGKGKSWKGKGRAGREREGLEGKGKGWKGRVQTPHSEHAAKNGSSQTVH